MLQTKVLEDEEKETVESVRKGLRELAGELEGGKEGGKRH